MTTVIEHLAYANTYDEAAQMRDHEQTQMGCIKARVIGDGLTKSWAVQSFYPDEPSLTDEQISFCLGLRRCLCPDWMLEQPMRPPCECGNPGYVDKMSGDSVESAECPNCKP